MSEVATASARAGQLDFLAALFLPLLTVEEAGFLLDDVSRDHVIHLVEEGRLRGFDISPAQNRERCIRVLRISVERLVIPAMRGMLGKEDLDLIISHQRQTLIRREVRTVLRCSPDHVANLLRTKDADGNTIKPLLTGPRHSTGDSTRLQRIDRASLLSFLTAREIHANL